MAESWYRGHRCEEKRSEYKHRQKRSRHGYKLEHKGKGGPPPWAPAYGHRSKRCRPCPSPAFGAPSCVVHYGWRREQVGTVIGGATGGLLGTQIGRGGGRTSAIIGGTLFGALVGGSVGRSIDRVDQVWVEQTLKYAPSREILRWKNPDTRVTYEVTPLAAFRDPVGRYCREYHTTAIIGGERQQIYGTACRQTDGSWQIAD